MNRRKLGGERLEASEIRLGCMGMGEFYGDVDEATYSEEMRRAVGR